MKTQGSNNVSHYHKSSENKMHTHRMSVFHNNVVSQADLSYLFVFVMYITVCKRKLITHTLRWYIHNQSFYDAPVSNVSSTPKITDEDSHIGVTPALEESKVSLLRI